MRAIVVDAPESVALRDVDEPQPGAQEVLVRSRFAGICATDGKILAGALPASAVRYPCIPGHEWSGTVEAVGDGVGDLAPGDPVVSEGLVWCGACPRCIAGETNLCENYDQLGFTRPGGFAELVVVPRRIVHRLPESMSLQAAALIEPAACVVRAFEHGGFEPGGSVAVVGVGALGSLAIQIAFAMRADRVVAYGLRDHELLLAERLGAMPVNATSDFVPEGGADFVVEVAGGVEATVLATRAARRGGKVVLVGTSGEGAMLTLPADTLVRRDLVLAGSLSYTAGAWSRALALATDGSIRLEEAAGRVVPYANGVEALAMVREHRAGPGRTMLEI